MIELRCSSLPRTCQCAPSLVAPLVRVESVRSYSDMGTAFHDCMAARIREGKQSGDIAERASRFNVPEEELAILVNWSWKIWEEKLSCQFPDPVMEKSLSSEDADAGISLSGHPDLYSIVEKEARGLDWKSGWEDMDAADQFRGYAALIFAKHPEVEVVRFTKLTVREQRAETFLWTRQEIDNWWEWVVGHLNEPDVFRTGTHCSYCPRTLECKAHKASLTALVKNADTMVSENVSVADLALMIQGARRAKRALDNFLDSAKAEVAARGGDLSADGVRMKISREERRYIDLPRAWDTLEQKLGLRKLIGLCKISGEAVKDAVKETAPPKMKGKMAEAIMDDLDKASALKTTFVEKLVVTVRELIGSAK